MFEFDKQILNAVNEAMKLCKGEFEKIEAVTEYNQQKVLKAFLDSKVSESHFAASTGYGYGDRGREVLDEVYSQIFCAESAIVRLNFLSGTHALTTALFGILRPGDKILSVTGMPYDTMLGVIGITPKHENKSKKIPAVKAQTGSLKEFGIMFDAVDLLEGGDFDYPIIKAKIQKFRKVIYVQKSSGYNLRGALSSKKIGELVDFIKLNSPESIVMVDNCYGEFVEKFEPTDHGAHLVVGSLIKNPGGGIAPCGAYIAGKKALVEQCAYRFSAPGIGSEIGATLGYNRELFMGTFNSPHVVGEALKTAVFASALFDVLGYEVYPKYSEERYDIIQKIKLNTPVNLVKFCQGLQSASPVDSAVTPEPWDMPGYDSKVIMAAGAFTLGSSIELSADAPIRKPYAVWLQGGLNFHSAKIAVLAAASAVHKNKM